VIRAGLAVRMGVMKNAYKILAVKPEATDHLGNLREDGKITLTYIFKK
jgi:hypothetical protein